MYNGGQKVSFSSTKLNKKYITYKEKNHDTYQQQVCS